MDRMSAAYDWANGRVLVVLGFELWAWDRGGGWRRVETRLPLKNVTAAAYDSARKRLVILDSTAGEIWEWDGANWSGAAAPGRAPTWPTTRRADAR